MYASVRRYEGISSETAREILGRAHGGFRNRLAGYAGFVAHEVVVAEDSMVAISVFENWVVAEETARIARSWAAQNLGDIALPAPQITAGEIYWEPGIPEPFSTSEEEARRRFRRRSPAP
jgi:hypothetical protein